ncbi:MAG: glycosyltransferase family 4 protein [Opitutales bacterium]|nr:glycosyltransferase family 4 protein [Opitutales bacterium]
MSLNVLYCLTELKNPGGIERVTVEKLNAFAFDPDVCPIVVTTSQMNQNSFFQLEPSVRHFDLGLHMGSAIYGLGGVIKRLRFLKQVRDRLEKILIREKVDVCVFVARPDFLIFPFRKWRGVIVVESHFAIKSGRYLRRESSSFRKYLNIVSTYFSGVLRRRADAFVVLTKHDQSILSKKENNIYQIYNPAPSFRFLPSAKRKKVVVAVGRLTFQKGFGFLIDAWRRIADEFSDWSLEIWGEGELRETLQAQIDNANLSQSVFLRGKTDCIEEKLQSAEVFVLSSIFEGFPMVILEAMSVGLPVVSFDCETGPRELIKENGYLVEPENSIALAESIKKVLIAPEDARREMGRSSLVQVRTFAPSVIMLQWKTLFRELIEKKNR